MANLSLLTDTERQTLKSSSSIAMAEVVVVTWPPETEIQGQRVYGWWNLLADPVYTESFTAWLDGRPFEARFPAAEPGRSFHRIPRTSSIGDDLIQMNWVNHDGAMTFPMLRGIGARIEFFYFLPQIGRAISQFTGHLMMPSRVEDVIEVQAGAGFRSGQMILPTRVLAVTTCQFQFGGELDAPLPECEYDRHIGGSAGNLDGDGQPFRSCKRVKTGDHSCTAIWGDTSRFGGFDVANESTLVGAGDHKTISTTVSNTVRLGNTHLGVAYGTGRLFDLRPTAFRRELNPSPEHQDAGTLVTLFHPCEGSIQSITEFEVLARQRAAGLLVKLGTHQQAATVFSPSILNYSHTVTVEQDLNPIDPRTITADQIVGKCKYVGKNDIKIYAADGTYIEAYTDNRADCTFDLITATRYGLKIAAGRYSIADIVALRTRDDSIVSFVDDQGNTRTCKRSTFTQYVTTGKAQDIINAICEAGWYVPPFDYDGVTRLIPFEKVALNNEVPVFTDRGDSRNIIWRGKKSTVRPYFKGDHDIVNKVTLVFNDAQIDWAQRTMVFADIQAQYRAGRVYGDTSIREVEAQFTGYGITNESEAVRHGMRLRDLGPFCRGGTQNNFGTTFEAPAWWPESLELHPGKIIKVESDNLDLGDISRESTGRPFDHFIVLECPIELVSTDDGPCLVRNVRAQAWPVDYIDSIETDAASGATPDGSTGGGGVGGTGSGTGEDDIGPGGDDGLLLES